MGTDGTSHVGISVCNLERHYVGKFGDNFVGNFERNYLGHFGRNYVGNLGRGYVNNFRKDCAVAGCRPRRERCVARACSLANCARAAAQGETVDQMALVIMESLGKGSRATGEESKKKTESTTLAKTRNRRSRMTTARMWVSLQTAGPRKGVVLVRRVCFLVRV